MDDLQDVLRQLPEEPDKALRSWARGLDYRLGGEVCIFRRESVELFPDDDPFLASPRRNRRVWGARCTCSACGEEFEAGFVSARQGGMQIKGIRLVAGDDGTLYPGCPAPDSDDFLPEEIQDIAEGESFDCPFCGSEVRLLHVSSARGGKTWQIMVPQISAVEGRLAVLYWMIRRTVDETACWETSITPCDAVILDRGGRLRRATHVRRSTCGGWSQRERWELCSTFRAPEELRYRTSEAVNEMQIGAVVWQNAINLAGTTGEKTGIEDYAKSGQWLSEYLMLWKRHPNAENLARQGWGCVLEHWLEDCAEANSLAGQSVSRDAWNIDWTQRKPHRMLRMDKKSFAALAGRWSFEKLGAWDEYRADDMTAAEFDAATNELTLTTITRINANLDRGREGMELSKLMPYLRKQEERSGQPVQFLATTYMDYRDMLAQRQAQPTEYELHPRDLIAAHGREAQAYKHRESSRFADDFARLRERCAPLAWSDGEICIRIAATPQELTQEGATLHHCVGTYHHKHAAGTDVIFFVRHARRPERSWYTLDICMSGREPTEVQLHGYRNEWSDKGKLHIPQRVREAVDRWKREILLPWWEAEQKKRKKDKRKRRIA